jgi:hypothetical protein
MIFEHQSKTLLWLELQPTTIWRIAKRTIGAQIDKQMLAPLDVSVPHVTKRTGKTGGRDL